MDKKAFQSLVGYNSAMAQARTMLTMGLILQQEYGIIETKMCEIYGINFVSIFREKDWISGVIDGNMAPTKEVL